MTVTDPGPIAERLGVPQEVVRRLQQRGFLQQLELDATEIRERLWRAHAAFAATRHTDTGVRPCRRRSPRNLGLTAREREVLACVMRGKTNGEIAEVLWIAPATVRKHLENVYAKLGVHTRTAAVARFLDILDAEASELQTHGPASGSGLRGLAG